MFWKKNPLHNFWLSCWDRAIAHIKEIHSFLSVKRAEVCSTLFISLAFSLQSKSRREKGMEKKRKKKQKAKEVCPNYQEKRQNMM